MVQCTKCLKFKVESNFRVRKDRGNRRTVCSSCENDSNLKRYHTRSKTKEAHRRAAYKYSVKQYGLTIEGYEVLLKEQENKCVICNSYQDRLHVDHDHTTGKIRGLLCHHCNVTLGHVKENKQTLLNMIKYLE